MISPISFLGGNFTHDHEVSQCPNLWDLSLSIAFSALWERILFEWKQIVAAQDRNTIILVTGHSTMVCK